MNYYERALTLKEETVAHRRYFHVNAEVGLNMPKGQAYVLAELEKLGIEAKPCGHGVSATVGKGGKCLLLRADMDALPMAEESGLDFACPIILVFDAYKVAGGRGSVEKEGGISVVYTKEAETADAYIERVTYEIGKKYRVRVATSDNLEQIIVLGHGAERVSARSFYDEVRKVASEISEEVEKLNRG